MRTMTALILMFVLALAGYAYSASVKDETNPVNRYFDHTGRYYTMEYYQ